MTPSDTRDYPVPIAPQFLAADHAVADRLEALGIEAVLFRFCVLRRPPRAQSERILSHPTEGAIREAREFCSEDDLHALAVAMREMADALEPPTAPITALAFHGEVRSIIGPDAPVSIDVRADDSGVLRLAVTTTGSGDKPGGTYRVRGATQRQLLDGLRDYFPDA